MVGTAGSDFEFDRPKTFGTSAFVCGSLFVDINPDIRIATVKSHPDEFSLFFLILRIFFGRLVRWFRRWYRVAGNIEHNSHIT